VLSLLLLLRAPAHVLASVSLTFYHQATPQPMPLLTRIPLARSKRKRCKVVKQQRAVLLTARGFVNMSLKK
jgi:hypothetical protein